MEDKSSSGSTVKTTVSVTSDSDRPVADIRGNFPLLERAVLQFDSRFSLRALRSISSIRKKLSAQVLATVITQTYSSNEATGKYLLAALKDAEPLLLSNLPTTWEKSPLVGAYGASFAHQEAIPEIFVYLSILIQVYLYDRKKYDIGARFSSTLVDKIRDFNRRTLDSMAGKAYFYFCLFYENLEPKLSSNSKIQVRSRLLASLRSSVLRKDEDTQAAVIVLLLRNYILTADMNQADALVQQITFPTNAPNNQVARYLYYLGRIRAIQLAYTEAHEHLMGASRKAPTSAVAVGFYQAAMKHLIVVELLMGDIPERSYFSQPKLERSLASYFELVKAVRAGEMQGFQRVVQYYAPAFHRDGTYTLVLRLRQNVIRTGIRRLSLSYSRISLRDICLRLGLESEESAEYIVAKAIRDCVIEATIDHEKGYMEITQAGDIYATSEPAEAFHERIKACLDLHDESVKAMRYPSNQHRLELKNAQEARERERELAKEIQDGEIDEDAAGDFDAL